MRERQREFDHRHRAGSVEMEPGGAAAARGGLKPPPEHQEAGRSLPGPSGELTLPAPGTKVTGPWLQVCERVDLLVKATSQCHLTRRLWERNTVPSSFLELPPRPWLVSSGMP